MEIRDILAVPFWAMALFLDKIAITIGGAWTSSMYLEHLRKMRHLIK